MATPQDHLDHALESLAATDDWQIVVDCLPVPIYITDIDGNVTYWNRACVDFAGREPTLGSDRWCVTWKIYTTSGELLPHDRCPMAEAIRERREIRGKVAIAMRPDGSRRAFTPYPTPLLDDDGNMTGAINMLIDVSLQQGKVLAEQADRCRRLAGATTDRGVAAMLSVMAEGYDCNAMAISG